MTQPGQITLATGLPGIPASDNGGIAIDQGGPEFTILPAGGGTVTLNGATPVVVADARVTAGSIIIFTLKTVGGTVGAAPVIDTITPGTGFTVKGSASDTSVMNYAIIG